MGAKVGYRAQGIMPGRHLCSAPDSGRHSHRDVWSEMAGEAKLLDAVRDALQTHPGTVLRPAEVVCGLDGLQKPPWRNFGC